MHPHVFFKFIVDSNERYFGLKGGIKLVAQILKSSKYQNTATGVLVTVTLGTALDTSTNQSENKDAVKNRIELLVTGVLKQIVTKLLVASIENNKTFGSIPSTEYILFLWMMLKNNDVTDLQRELFDLDILNILQQTIKKHEKTSNSILALGIAVLRRLITCIFTFNNSGIIRVC
jgi:hypothetical protein